MYARLTLLASVVLAVCIIYGVGFFALGRHTPGVVTVAMGIASALIIQAASSAATYRHLVFLAHASLSVLAFGLAVICYTAGEPGQVGSWFFALAAGGAAFLFSERGAFVWITIVVATILAFPLLDAPDPGYVMQPWELPVSQVGLAIIFVCFAVAIRRVTEIHVATVEQHATSARALQAELAAAIAAVEPCRADAAAARAEAHAARAEMREAHAEAETARDVKSRFLANMSYELRTPMNSVLGYTELLLADLAGSESHYDDLTRVHSAAQQLAQAIDQLLEFGSVESGRVDVAATEFAIAAPVRAAVENLRVDASERGVSVGVSLPSADERMRSDEQRTQQIIEALLRTAIKFTNRSVLRVDVRCEDGDVDVVVEDLVTDVEDPRRVSLSASSSDERVPYDFGVELLLARAQTRLLGGRIEASGGDDDPLVLRVQLPRELPSPGQRRASSSGKSGVYRALVIDDDIAACELVQRQLAPFGVVVETANDGEVGVKMAKETRPHVILLDVMLPRMDGWEVLQALQADGETARIPVVMLSMVDDAERSQTLGAVRHLVKPVGRERLRAVLGDVGLNLMPKAN